RADRRDHRLDVRAGEVRLAAARPGRAAARRDEPAGRARDAAGAGGGDVSAHADVHAAHPPAAHQSSRVDSRVLGMFLFIASEVMLFGSFFTVYFFDRVVNPDAGPWPPPPFHRPVLVAGVNTAILVTSSFTIHWA